MKVGTFLDIRSFFDCDDDEYAEELYQSAVFGAQMDCVSLHSCVAHMLYELLDTNRDKNSGFEMYCDETAVQIMTGMYKNFDAVQAELWDLEDDAIDPDDEYDMVPLEEADKELI